MPAHGAFLTGAPLIEIMLGIAVLAVASMCLGLLVSALVSTSEKAMPFLVLLTMAQVILSGGVLLLAAARLDAPRGHIAVPLGLRRGGHDRQLRQDQPSCPVWRDH